MNLSKTFFYIFFYLHLIACYFWIALGYNSAQRFYRENDLNLYQSTEFTHFLGEDGNPIEANVNYDIMYGEIPTFEAKSWRRWTIEDSPDFETINANWEGRTTQWYPPLDWVNYGDIVLFTKEYSLY